MRDLAIWMAIFIASFIAGCSNVKELKDYENHEYSNNRLLNSNDLDKVIFDNKIVKSLLDKGVSLMGTRYKYGGINPNGFDCSGFIYYLFSKEANINLPRTAYQQSLIHGKKINKNELKAGDLVFFKTMKRQSVSHVGIYIGNNQFLHASNKKYGVRVDRLDTGYWGSRYSSAKRVFYSFSDENMFSDINIQKINITG